MNYKFSAEVHCKFIPGLENIIHVTKGGNHEQLGDRTFGLFMDIESFHMFVLEPNSPLHQRSDKIACTEGDWVTISVEVRQIEEDPATLRYTTKVNDTPIHTATYLASYAANGEEFQVFVSDDFYNAASKSYVRNFVYQTFEEIPSCGTDPCAGLENCETIINGCDISPVRNNLLATVTSGIVSI